MIFQSIIHVSRTPELLLQVHEQLLTLLLVLHLAMCQNGRAQDIKSTKVAWISVVDVAGVHDALRVTYCQRLI